MSHFYYRPIRRRPNIAPDDRKRCWIGHAGANGFTRFREAWGRALVNDGPGMRDDSHGNRRIPAVTHKRQCTARAAFTACRCTWGYIFRVAADFSRASEACCGQANQDAQASGPGSSLCRGADDPAWLRNLYRDGAARL